MLIPLFEGGEHVHVTRLGEHYDDGHEMCLINIGDEKYYGKRSVDSEKGIVTIFIPEMDAIFEYKIVNA